MRASILAAVLLVASAVALAYATLAVGRPAGPVWEDFLGVSAAVCGVAGALILLKAVWGGGEEGEYLESYELLGGAAVCRAERINRHKCVVRAEALSMGLEELFRSLVKVLPEACGYRVRERLGPTAVMCRGSVMGRGFKGGNVTLVVFRNDDEGSVELTYILDPLHARGLVDLKEAADEVEGVLRRVVGGSKPPV